ncbi:MAG: hypothetical protein KDB01_13185 [Planctomycetaceae bacterium]|nr:hypothetical protein [Planctomycetaceae bacterium]
MILKNGGRVLLSITVCMLLDARLADAQPRPVLNTIFPVGGQAGTTVEVTISGNSPDSLGGLHSSVPGLECKKLDTSRFQLTIPAATLPGLYDIWALGENGVSSVRTFAISRREEHVETESNDSAPAAMRVKLNTIVNGQIEKAGDADYFEFHAQRGQRVVIECQAERIDSRLRAVLEVFDAHGRRLAVNRGYYGIDPLIDFPVPADGSYVVKVHDLVLAGGVEYFYRLDLDTRPRVAFSVPSVIERGKAARVAFYGWNLSESNVPPASKKEVTARSEDSSAGTDDAVTNDAVEGNFDCLEVDIPATLATASWPLPVRLNPSQTVLEGASFSFHPGGCEAPVVIGLTDVPVVLDRPGHQSPAAAQEIDAPCEISGQLTDRDECDWFSMRAKRGEVFYLEAYGQRINSPVDLQVRVLDATDRTHVAQQISPGSSETQLQPSLAPMELARFNDEVVNPWRKFPTSHLDPAGRWTCPADGRYLIAVRNLIGGLRADARRVYRLSVRREEPDFQLLVVPHGDDPAGINIPRGGREILDVLAFRRRGMDESIRISAFDLPAGIECPDVWLGPGVDRTSVVVSATQNAEPIHGELHLRGTSDETAQSNSHAVRGGVIVRSGTPEVWGRIAAQVPIAIVNDTPLRITANADEPLEHHLYGTLQVKHSPGGVLDLAVDIERRDSEHQAPVRLTAVGLPGMMLNEAVTVPAGQQKGYLSFYLPPTLTVGRYSIVVQAETTVSVADQKTETVVVYSNPVTFDVQPAAFLVEVDPFAVTRARRGETIQIGYSAQRINGFIGKMHTELAAPGLITDVVGLRGRGETFVGQTDKGSLQIVVNNDAPLGPQRFLRLFTVGVVEDQPVYFGSRFISLEIIE